MNDDDFYLEIARALTGCQLVEQQLKLYISESLDLAKKCIDGRMPFKFSGSDYQDSALDSLIKTFKKLSDNSALAQSLDSFKNERNFLSHKGITYCLDPDFELSIPEKSKMEERLSAIRVEAGRLYLAIHEEANKFRGHLYFDDLPDAD